MHSLLWKKQANNDLVINVRPIAAVGAMETAWMEFGKTDTVDPAQAGIQLN